MGVAISNGWTRRRRALAEGPEPAAACFVGAVEPHLQEPAAACLVGAVEHLKDLPSAAAALGARRLEMGRPVRAAQGRAR